MLLRAVSDSWFLKKSIQNNPDIIFKDWVVLYVELGILKYKNAKFCPCNASKSKGTFINGNMNNIESIFAVSVSTFVYPRSLKMLSSCPTDGQAEILIEDNIPREYINGIAVGNEEIAKRVYAMLRMYGLEHIRLYIAPDVLTPNWSNMVRNGHRPDELQCAWLEEE